MMKMEHRNVLKRRFGWWAVFSVMAFGIATSVFAGNDPTSSGDTFCIESITPDGLGGMTLTWPAKSNRFSTGQCSDGNLVTGVRFTPAGLLTNLSTSSNGLLQATGPETTHANQRTNQIIH